MENRSPRVKRKLWKWARWTLLFLLGWFILFFFLFGPGRVLFPRLLISYSHVTDNTNTVYYSGDNILKALDILWMATTVRDSIQASEGDAFCDACNQGVVIVLSESLDQYQHLTWNCTLGAPLMRRIVLNPSTCKTDRVLYTNLKREIQAVCMSRYYGRIPALLKISDGDEIKKH